MRTIGVQVINMPDKELDELYLAISSRKQNEEFGGGGYLVSVGATLEDFKLVGLSQTIVGTHSFRAKDYKDPMFNAVMESFIKTFPAKKVFLIVDKFFNEHQQPDYELKIELTDKKKLPDFATLIGKSN